MVDECPAARAVPPDQLLVQALQHRTAKRERGLHDGFRDGRLLREVEGVHEDHPDGPGSQQRGTGRGEGGLPDGRLIFQRTVLYARCPCETRWTVSGGAGTGTPDAKSGRKCARWCR